MQIRENVPISGLTTMRLGGAARYVIDVETKSELASAVDFARERSLPIWVMGGGANTIGHDEGFAGVIILNQLKGIFAEQNGQQVPLMNYNHGAASELKLTAMAGEVWDDFVAVSCKLGFSGIEAMSMIPGSVGAAPVQNIGAYGQDIAQVIESVEVFDRQTGKFITLTKPEMKMSYRHTRFNCGQDAGRFIIVSITVKLHHGELRPPFYNSLQTYIESHHETDFSPANIRRMVCEIRSEKLPDPKHVASAGSFFKNVYLDKVAADAAAAQGIPIWRSNDGSGKINSGWLIEQCGLKGQTFFGFKVSEKAALVLINESARTYADLAQARAKIVNAVKNKFGYELEQEPVEISNSEES